MRRDGYATPLFSRPAVLRLKGLAGLTASLMLSACSQTADLLPSAEMTTADTTSTASQGTSPQSELQKATMYWGKEFTEKPAELQPALNFARNLKALGEKQKALSVLQQASTFHSANPELAGEYGRLALELDQVSVAERLLAAADNPSQPDWRITSARGTVLAKQGKYTEAIPLYERALQLSAGQPSVLNNLAMAHAMLGDAAKAESILRSASSQAAATPKVRENLALVLELQGRHAEAQQVAALAKKPIAVAGPSLSEPQVARAPVQPATPSLASAIQAVEPQAAFKTEVTPAAPVTQASFKPSTVDTNEAPAKLVTRDVWHTDVATAVPAPSQR